MLLRTTAVLAAVLFASAAHGEPDEPALGAELAPLLAHARARQPDIAARARAAEAAMERIGPAAALPDPRVQIELMDFTNSGDGRDASLVPGEVGNTRYRVIQPLPFWGKRELRGQLARAQAEAAGEERRLATLESDARVKGAFARYYRAVGQRRIQGETLVLLEALERLVLSRYGLGLVPQQDALRAQTEISAMKIDLIESGRLLAEARAQLNASLPRPAAAPLADPLGLPPLPAELELEALNRRALANSPELAARNSEVAAAEASRAIAYRERYPDFSLGLTNNRPRSGADSWDLMLEVSIPLQQQRRRSEERGAERALEATRARVASLEARIEGRLGELLAALQAARERTRMLAGSLLPQARATLAAAESGYESGRVNFDTLIEAERQILRTRLALLDSEVAGCLSLVEIERIVGDEP